MTQDELSKIEVALSFLEKGLEMPTKYKDYTEKVFSGPVLAGLSKKSHAALQDCRGVLQRLLESSPTRPTQNETSLGLNNPPTNALPLDPFRSQLEGGSALPASPVAPPTLTVKIKWDALDDDCPVCGEVSTLGLLALINRGQEDARVQLLVCGSCITLGKIPKPSSRG